jgi:phosphate transport system permease protein
MTATGNTTLKRAHRRDRFARWVVTIGGVAVIASVTAILFLIAGTTVPLFLPAKSQTLGAAQLHGLASGTRVVHLDVDASVDGRALTAYVFADDGTLWLIDVLADRLLTRLPLCESHTPAKPRLRAVATLGAAAYGLLWSDGRLSVVEVIAHKASTGAVPSWSIASRAEIPAGPQGVPRQMAMRRPDAEHLTCALLYEGNLLTVLRQVTRENLVGDVVHETQYAHLDKDLPGPITALALDAAGRTVYAGTANGCLVTWHLDDRGRVTRQERIPAFPDGRSITTMGLLLGDVTLAVGDARGELSTWLPRRYTDTPQAPRKLMLARTWSAHGEPLRNILPSGRNKSLLTLATDGAVDVYHTTSGRHLLRLHDAKRLEQVAWTVRGDVILGLQADGRLAAWRLHCPHPEVSWSTLFGRLLYEGYDVPAYVWQTTGGEEYEPKFSLIPLLFGTLKGTFYAMLFAAPLGLFGAIYVSHFTMPGFRRVIKPCVEVLAALPSVVVGFLVALWLAPLVERYVIAVLASVVTVPVCVAAFLAVWRPLRHRAFARRVERGYEFLAVLPAVLLGVALAVWLVGPLERLLFDGNFQLWLHQHLHTRYDQRNCIIIAFGLGLAVIPLIFSLTDDALSNVPHSLSAASLALGASRWQTVWHVVLPSASPAIFAAMMIGFGRAVGETMIVLMATGNTPLIDWSPWNGMRTLSANIAVEIPEAPVGGTLYRILFLCAVLLFLLTFILNTVAEVVRQRLRRRYGRY